MRKLITLFAVIFALLLGFLIPSFNEASAGDSYDGHMVIGKNYLVKGSYDKANFEFTMALKLKPNSAEALIERGTTYNQLGDYQKAIEDFSKAITLSNKNYLAFNNRGVAYFRSGEVHKAIEDLQKAISLNSKDPFARLNYAGALLSIDRGAGAAKSLSTWLSQGDWKGNYAGHAAVLTVLGFQQAGLVDDASGTLKTALGRVNRLEWPYPVLKFLDGKLKADELLAEAKDSDYDTTQANCFIALKLLNSKQPKQAEERLVWLVKYGTKNSVEYWLGKNLIEKKLKKKV